MRHLFVFLISTFLLSCTQKSIALLNADALNEQTIRINTNRDTIIRTSGGAILEISKQSFSGNENEVMLGVKEAYLFEDMVRAGLTTQANGKPLSSGGMISINTKSNGLKLLKPIRVSLPTTAYDVNMKVFKGELQNGKMNWREPQSLEDSLQIYLEEGKLLFQQNCATCHSYQKTVTGPAMAGLEGRGPWSSRKELFTFTRNPAGYIPRTCYTKNLIAQFGGQIMPAFPALTDENLNAVYNYILAQDIANGLNQRNNYANSLCDDSCYRYDSVRFRVEDEIAVLNRERQNLIDSNEDRINYQRLNNTGTANLTNTRDGSGPMEKVNPRDYKAVYYRFDITSLGWYNIDKLIDLPEEEQIKIKVTVDETLSDDWDVFIAVPQYKIFDRGGLLSDRKKYGFFNLDGNVPVPAGTEVIVFVLGEIDGKIAYGYENFISLINNEVDLYPKLSTKEDFNAAIKRVALPGLIINAADSKNADGIRKVDAVIKLQQDKIEFFRPKMCDCSCGIKADSTVLK